MRDYQRGLSLARLKSVLHFDPSTGDWTRLVDRGGQLAGTRAGCLTKRGYEVMLIDGYMYYSHRLAWFYMTGEWPPEEIDHRDMNKRNNRWDNLGNYILESLFHGYASFSFPTLVARRLRFFAGFDLGLGR